MSTFTDRTLVVSGGSRGIGLAIALGAAKQGANVVLLAKTAEPHPKLPGTVHTAVADVEAEGGTTPSAEVSERPRRDACAADEHEPTLAGRPSDLHVVEVRDDAAVAGLGRRVCRGRHRVLLPLAGDVHRDVGGGQPGRGQVDV